MDRRPPGGPDTLHALRRTCASVLVALGKDPRYVMAQLGHTDPTVTLGAYAQAMTSSNDDRELLRLLTEGDDFTGHPLSNMNEPITTSNL